jgi:mannosyltransferase OCH1-like enzyme
MYNCNIPKIIHQTWKNNKIPTKWKKSQKMWKKLHPDWKYILWTNKMIRKYIKKNYPDFLSIHDNYKYPIQRADMIRYFILKDFGGIYSDLDLYPIVNIEKYFISNNNEAYFVFSGNYPCFTNSLMASKPNAKIWNYVLEELKKKANIWYGKHFTVICSTGPLMLTSVLAKYTDVIGFLPKKKFMAYSTNDNFLKVKKDAIILPLKGCSWNGFDSIIINKLNQYKYYLICLIIISYINLIKFYISNKKLTINQYKK